MDIIYDNNYDIIIIIIMLVFHILGHLASVFYRYCF